MTQVSPAAHCKAKIKLAHLAPLHPGEAGIFGLFYLVKAVVQR